MPRSQPFLRAVAALQLVVAVGLAAVVLFGRLRHGDPLLFLAYIEPLADGRIPYRDFPLEYPPLGYLAIVLPWLLSGADVITRREFHALFSVQGGLMAAATGICAAWLAGRGWGFSTPARTALTYLALVLALLPVVIWRFDILPAFLSAIALVCVAAGRPGLAGAAFGLGAVTKIFPALLVPAVLVYYVANGARRSAALLVLGFAVAAGVVMAPFLLAAGPDALSFVAYQDERGFEVESTVAGVALLVHAITGTGANIYFDFGALQLSSPVIEDLSLVTQVAQAAVVAAILAAGLIGFRSDLRARGSVSPRTLVAGLFGVLLAIMLINKVLSPQYLVWLLPFGALVPRLQATTLFAAAVLTTLVYPLGFDALLRVEMAPVLALNARNLLLAVLFVLVVVDLVRGRSSGEAVDRVRSSEPRGAPAHDSLVCRAQVRRRDGSGDARGAGSPRRRDDRRQAGASATDTETNAILDC